MIEIGNKKFDVRTQTTRYDGSYLTMSVVATNEEGLSTMVHIKVPSNIVENSFREAGLIE